MYVYYYNTKPIFCAFMYHIKLKEPEIWRQYIHCNKLKKTIKKVFMHIFSMYLTSNVSKNIMYILEPILHQRCKNLQRHE
jgi:hypothetical protein